MKTIIPLQAAAPAGCATSSTRNDNANLHAPDNAPRAPHQIALMLTRKCNMACSHCSVESGPHVKTEPTEDELVTWLREAAQSGVRSVLLTGGEPMMRQESVLRLLRECRELGLSATMTSNGFWGKTPERAHDTLKKLRDAGLGQINISYDRYHAEYQGAQPAVHIAQAAKELDFVLHIGITRTREDADLAQIVSPFDEVPNALLRFYDVQPVGRARDFDASELRGETGGFCNAASAAAITDDGRVVACNGPSYFSDAVSPLICGSLSEEPMPTLLARHRSDPILDTIRTFGPNRLRDELCKLDATFELRPNYAGMCDLCLHLTSQPAAMETLREHLSQPRFALERHAATRVIAGARASELNRDVVNGAGACRVWLRALREPSAAWASEAEKILGRADFDWHAQISHLAQCGAAGALQNALREPALARWAPRFFVQELQKTARTDALRTLVQREALRRFAQIARDLNVKIVLLKGSAMLAQAQDRVLDLQKTTPLRSCGDIDVWISPDDAPRVRQEMLRRGFDDPLNGKWRADTRTLDQLEALSFRGVSIEIHQHLMAGYFDLPEAEMWTSTQALSHADWNGLSVMSPEANVVFSVMHTAKHLWTHGLKTTLDVLWTTEGAPTFDWSQVARWIARGKMKRGFMATIVALEAELAPGFPADILALAPRDALQKKLEELARRHVFGVRPAANEQEEDGRRRVLLTLMSDSRTSQLRCAASILTGKTRLRSLPHQNRSLAARARAVHRAWRSWNR